MFLMSGIQRGGIAHGAQEEWTGHAADLDAVAVPEIADTRTRFRSPLTLNESLVTKYEFFGYSSLPVYLIKIHILNSFF